LAMAKKLRPAGSGDQDPKTNLSGEAPGSSGQIGAGSSGTQIWVNDRGEVCIGNDCYTVAIDRDRREVRTEFRPSEDCNIEDFTGPLREVLAKGARSIIEIQSDWKPA